MLSAVGLRKSNRLVIPIEVRKKLRLSYYDVILFKTDKTGKVYIEKAK